MRESFGSLPQSIRGYIEALSLVYLVIAILALPHSRVEVTAGLVAIFATAGLVRPVPSPFGGITDAISGVVVAAALLWQSAEVLLGVGIGSFIGLLAFRRNEVWRAAINGAGWGLPAAAAAAVPHAVMPRLGTGLVSLITGAILAAMTFRFINTGIFAVYRSQRFRRSFILEWPQTLAFQWPSQLLSASPAVVLAAINSRIETVWSGLALTAAYTMVLPVARQELAYYNRSREMLGEAVEAVVRALEGIDPNARAHGDRVSALAVETGRRLGMSEHRLLALRLASRLHDVGFLAGPDGDTAEQHHAAVGGRILARFPDPLIGRFVRAHHEDWDGQGFPDRLGGEAIPLGARILAAAELYDSARAGLRPFERPRSPEEAADYLTSVSGTALDPRVVPVLLEVAREHETRSSSAGAK